MWPTRRNPFDASEPGGAMPSPIPSVRPNRASTQRRRSVPRSGSRTEVTAWERAAGSATFNSGPPGAAQASNAAQSPRASRSCRAQTASTPSSWTIMSSASRRPYRWCVGPVPLK